MGTFISLWSGLKLPLKQMGKLRLKRGHSSAELTAGLHTASRDTENGGRLCQVSSSWEKGGRGPHDLPSPLPQHAPTLEQEASEQSI